MADEATHAAVTPRERSMLAALLEGESIRAAADSLGIREATARVHMRNLHAKTGTHTIGGLFAWCLDHASCCLAQNS
jgi:DNA-binding CsgD family transcriptional regulator